MKEINDSDDDYDPHEDGEVFNTAKPIRASTAKFLVGHPQRLTHDVYLLSEKNARIPMFCGGLIPREDQGNLEDFYVTMLTLYKPWRTGRDLKAPEQTWKDAHEEYSYHQRFVDIQKYCKIRYECLDARDDYRQSRK
ncbi:hypothetical protein PENSPDRAFT_596371, partial [Peniophora sp. CONT]